MADEEDCIEGGDPIMLQSMQNRFIRDNDVNAHIQKFSSSVGFRDMPPKHKSSSRLRKIRPSPDQRSTGYSRWTKGSHFSFEPNSASANDYYQRKNKIETEGSSTFLRNQVPGIQNLIRILHKNCDELSRKFSNTHKEYEIVQDLITENEEHFIDLIENTDRFLLDLQESSLIGQSLPPQETHPIENSNAKQYILELENIAGGYNSDYNNKTLLTQNTPYRTFSSAKSRDRGNELKEKFTNRRELALFDRINDLQNQIYRKDYTNNNKYDSVVQDLERKLLNEQKKQNEVKRDYQVLAQTTINFQAALKELQKAVRAKNYNIVSFKKVFDERSKQLTSEIQKYKKNSKDFRDVSPKRVEQSSENSRRTRTISPGSSNEKQKLTSGSKMSPTNLNRVYYESEANRKNNEIEKLLNEIERLEKQIENQKIKKQQLNNEKQKLNELLVEKESVINEKDQIILSLQKSINSKKEGNQEDSDGEEIETVQIYKKILENSNAEIEALKNEIKRLEAQEKEVISNSDDAFKEYRKKIMKEKMDAEELIDDTQTLIDSKIRNLNSRLSEKEKLLNKIMVEVRERVETAKVLTQEKLKNEHEETVNSLRLAHKTEINSLKGQIESLQSQQQDSDEAEATQKKIDDLLDSIKKKVKEIKDKNDEIINLNTEINKKDDEIISLSDQLLSSKAKHSKEMKELKQDLSKSALLAESNAEILLENTTLKSQISDLESTQTEKALSFKLSLQEKESEIRKLTLKISDIEESMNDKHELKDKQEMLDEAQLKIKVLTDKITELRSEHSQAIRVKQIELENTVKEKDENFETEKEKIIEEFENKQAEFERKMKELNDKFKKLDQEKTKREEKWKEEMEDMKNKEEKRISEIESKYKDEIQKVKTKLEQK